MKTTDLPSGIVADVREMTGEEEDAFLDRKKQADGRAVNHLLRNCVDTIRVPNEEPRKPTYEEVANWLTADRLTVMLAVREETYGPDIKTSFQCEHPECRRHFPLHLTTEVDWFSKTIADFPNGQYEITLSDGTRCAYSLLNGGMEQQLGRASQDELPTMTLLVPLVGVTLPDGTALPTNDKKRWLKKLSSRLREEIRTQMEESQLGPDTRFVADCPHCGWRNLGALERLPGFFFPSTSNRTVGL